MQETLYKALLDYKSLGRSSFHTPGHKNNFYSKIELLSLDYTELPMTDSLYEANGAIKASEEKVSKLYGSKASFFSSGGNTLCMQAMIRLCAGRGEKILCDRLVHRSAVSAMALLGIEPIWVKRNFKNGIAWDIDIKDLESKLAENKDAKAFYLTSPNYFGVMQDISLISKVCSRFGIPVIVDNAHGAHLKFLGLHPLDFGAAMTADSAHKTLPVLTAGAWLHVNEEKFKNKAKSAMALFGSTSPSYPIMASLDIARCWLEKNGEKQYKALSEKVSDLKKLSNVKDMFLNGIDPARITINASALGFSGYELRDELYKYKIEPEMCGKYHVVLIPTPFNSEEDWRRLENFVKEIKPKDKKIILPEAFEMNIPKRVYSLTDGVMSDFETVPLNACLGKVAAEIVCPCPPGVPVVMPGEEIGAFEKESLFEYGITEINVVK
mgnify:FL=1